MPDGMHLMIPASEYAAMEERIERLEKALDKACKTLVLPLPYKTAEQWKEWCMKDEDR